MMRNLKIIVGVLFLVSCCAACAKDVYAWRGGEEWACDGYGVNDGSPIETISFEQSGIRIVSSGTIPTELSNSRFGIPVSTATWAESLEGYRTYSGRIEYKDYSILNFYDNSGKRIKRIKEIDIIGKMGKKAGMPKTVTLPECFVNISTAGYVAFNNWGGRFSAVGAYNGLGEEVFSNSIEAYPGKLEDGKYYAQWGPGIEISGDGSFIGIGRGYGDMDSLDPKVEMNSGYDYRASLVILNRKGQFVREIFYKNASTVACPTLSWSGHYGLIKGGGGEIIFFDVKDAYFVAFNVVGSKGMWGGAKLLDDGGNYEIWLRTRDYKKWLRVPYRLTSN